MMNKEDVDLLNQVPAQCTMAEVDEIKVPCIDALLDEKTKNLKNFLEKFVPASQICP